MADSRQGDPHYCLSGCSVHRQVHNYYSYLSSYLCLSLSSTQSTFLPLASVCLREGASVLVHGTEGTDSTLQVTSLAQIILDPACRTIQGFQALVEREWLQAGHPFQQRCSQSAYNNSKPRCEAPVFLLFLDCVWQILRQFPCSFQFSQHFLVLLFEHAYASQFGTFVGNSASERSKLNLSQKTVSLWSWVNRPQEVERLSNPLYEANCLVIWPSVAPQSLLLWEGKNLAPFLTPDPKCSAHSQVSVQFSGDSRVEFRVDT
uniref:Myotubularin related protein 9 n=1 Tax=Hucho hucho TaxID=62062 RepID=A0A4W5R7R4_9TELE